MKPAPITYVVESTTGGVRRHVVDLLLNLDRNLHPPSLFCSMLRDPHFAEDAKRIEASGAVVRSFPMRRSIRPAADLRAILALRRFLMQQKPAIVHTHSTKAGLIGRAAAALAGARAVVHTPHVFPFQIRANILLRFAAIAAERLFSRTTGKIVCVSESERQAAIKAGIRPDKLVVIRNGVDCDALEKAASVALKSGRTKSTDEPAEVVGFVGRLVPQKGVEYLLRSAPAILSEFPAARFVIVGDGPLKENLRLEAARLGISDHCAFLGAREDVPAILATFTILALPSLWESAPYAILEAMALGVPVVASNVGGVPEIIPSDDFGLLVPPEDPHRLASAVRSLLRDPRRRRHIADATRQRVRNEFRLSAMISALHQLYAGIVDEQELM